MALKDILVHLDATDQSKARMETAVNLAADHGAHLIGLYVLYQPPIPGYASAQIPAEVLEAQREALREEAVGVEKAFLESTDRAGVSSEWRCVEGHPVEITRRHGRYCDVIVIGQRDPEGWVNEPGDMPEGLVLSAGRPCLVVPYAGRYPKVGERCMVAWDGSRTAARAISDALPFLEKAKHVAILVINPDKLPEGGLGDLPGANICQHLARHGVKAEAQHLEVDDMGVADMLLSRAADEGVDLFVMGCYGHSRWRELVLGGVTVHLFEHMTMPVLMSH